MAYAASDALENLIIDHLFRGRTWSKPAAVYVGLLTAGPSDAGGGTEVIGGSYARVPVPASDANWAATQGGTAGDSSGSGGMTRNAIAIVFPTPTASWGTVTHVGIFSAATGGLLLIWQPIATPRTVIPGGVVPSFPPGTLMITVD